MSSLKQIFLNNLREADEKAYDPSQDEVPLQNRLDQAGLPSDALDVEPGPENTGYKAEVTAAEGWIEEIDKFVKYLNDTEQGSINQQINTLDRDKSVFKGIASRVSDKIARVSSDLAELKEIIAGFVISSDRKAKNIRLADSVDISDLTLSEQSIEKLSRYGFDIVNITESSCKMILESDEEIIRAEINDDGLVNGENIDLYLDRLAKEYNIEQIIPEDIIADDIVEEDVVMDEKILKQIKEIDSKLATKWDYTLYIKRKELLSKMETPYIDAALSLMGEKD